MKRNYWIMGALLVGPVLWTVFWYASTEPTPSTSSSSTRRDLQVTAGRGASGFAFTNREASAATDCRVEVPDGQTTWVSSTAGVIPHSVAPLETVRIGWSNFGAGGQRMPEYVGINQKRYDITCTVDGSVLRVAVGYD